MGDSTVTAALARDVVRFINRGDSTALADLLLQMSEPQRRALMPAFKEYLRSLDWSDSRKLGPLIVAGAACLPTAAQVAAWFRRREFRWHQWQPEAIVRVLLGRDVPWFANLATRVAEGLPAEAGFGQFAFAAELVRISGAPIPTNDSFVRGWIQECFRGSGARERLRADPFLEALLPRVFEVDGVGALLDVTSWQREQRGFDPAAAGVGALASLAAEERINREQLLDGIVGRLLRGDRPGALRPFVALHHALQPTVDELNRRRLDYLRLLPDAPSFAASLAQQALRRLGDAGLLPLDTLIDASHPVLQRPEKTLVRAQLSWLQAAIRKRSAPVAPDLLLAVAEAFAHPDLNLAERALSIVERHIDTCTDDVRADLAAAASALGADLRARAEASLGKRAAPPAGPPPAQFVPIGPQVTPAPPPSSPDVPPPITSTAELAAELVAVLDRTDSADPVAWERVLDGLVRLSSTQPVDLRAAVRPLCERYTHLADLGGWYNDFWPERHLLAVIVAALGTTAPRKLQAFGATMGARRQAAARLRPSPGSGPLRVFVSRLEEIRVSLASAPVPFLLAAPTSSTGHVAAAALVDRLATFESAGLAPWPNDLEQALLRLPRAPDAEAAARAGTLRSSAGHRLAAWLAQGGLADPVMLRFTARRSAWPDGRPSATRGDPPAKQLVAVGPASEPGRVLIDALYGCRPGEISTMDWMTEVWPAVLPSHREVAAAHLLRSISTCAESDVRGEARTLPLLAECTGPVGPTIALGIAYGLSAKHRQDTAAAIDALLHLAAAGHLATGAVGTEIGGLAICGNIKLGRVVNALTEITRTGADQVVWCIAAAAVPALLNSDKPPRGTADLLQLAAKVAASVGVAGHVHGLDAIAERSDASRLATEARRLQRVLSTAGEPAVGRLTGSC